MSAKRLILWGFPVFWLAYLGMLSLSVGIRLEHIVLAGTLLILFFAHQKTRAWALAFSPFALFGILYDSLRMVPLSWRGPIHIQEPLAWEGHLMQWLGLPEGFLPTNFFLFNHSTAFDIFTAGIYSLHVFVPVLFALWLWFKKSPYFTTFTWTFLIMNIVANISFILYPTAPPWYVTQYGFAPASWDMLGDAAGLLRFDQLIGIPYFENTYAHASWNFGAIPSLHAAFPFLVSLFAWKALGKGRWFFYSFTAAVAFSAVYLNHHYVIDILAGWAYALVSFVAFVVVPAGFKKRRGLLEDLTEESLEGATD